MPTSVNGRHLGRLWSAEGIALVTGLVQGLVVARAFGPDLYGVYALTLTFAGFVFLAIDPRSGDAIVRYLTEFRRDEAGKSRAIIRAGLTLDVAWGAGGLLLVSALTYPVSVALHIDKHATLIPVAALGLCVAAPTATSRAVLGVFDRFDAISKRQAAVAIVRALGVCCVALIGGGLAGVIWTLTAISVIECFLFVSAALRVSREELGGGVAGISLISLRGRRREIARFLAYSSATTLMSSAYKQLDTLVLGAIAGPREAGYYRLAKSLTAPGGSVATPVSMVLYPRLARYRSDPEKSRDLVRRTFVRTELPLALLALMCLPLVAPAVHLLAGPEFEGAVAPSVALIVAVAVSFSTLHVRPLFLLRNQVRSLLLFMTLIASLSIVGFVPAAHFQGAEGVAWVRTGVLACGSLAMALFVRKRWHPADQEAEPRPAAAMRRVD